MYRVSFSIFLCMLLSRNKISRSFQDEPIPRKEYATPTPMSPVTVGEGNSVRSLDDERFRVHQSRLQ